MRLTKKRAQILTFLKTSREALTVKQIRDQLSGIDTVTIYRALDLFVAEGLVKRLMLDGDEAQFEYQHEPHHHAVCGDCNKVIHFSLKDEELQKLLPLDNFSVSEVELTVRGHCT